MTGDWPRDQPIPIQPHQVIILKSLLPHPKITPNNQTIPNNRWNSFIICWSAQKIERTLQICRSLFEQGIILIMRSSNLPAWFVLDDSNKTLCSHFGQFLRFAFRRGFLRHLYRYLCRICFSDFLTAGNSIVSLPLASSKTYADHITRWLENPFTSLDPNLINNTQKIFNAAIKVLLMYICTVLYMHVS